MGSRLHADYPANGVFIPRRNTGSRNKLKEAFLKNLCEAWEKHGVVAIEKVAKDDPTAFVHIRGREPIAKGDHRHDGEPITIVLIKGDENL